MHVISIFEPMFAREEEREEAFREVVEAVESGLEIYELLRSSTICFSPN